MPIALGGKFAKAKPFWRLSGTPKKPMLESAEIGHKISKKTYAQKEPQLREALLNAQFDLSQTRRGPVLIVLSGVQAGGRGETANKLTEWMDPRHIRVVAFGRAHARGSGASSGVAVLAGACRPRARSESFSTPGTTRRCTRVLRRQDRRRPHPFAAADDPRARADAHRRRCRCCSSSGSISPRRSRRSD